MLQIKVQNCLKQCVIAFCVTFFFFENAKIWVGRTTLNREKKGDGLNGKKKYSVSSAIQLAEALSLAKNGIITLWVDPHKDPSKVPREKRGKALFTNALEQATFCRTYMQVF